MNRHLGKHGRHCFKNALMKEKKIKYVKELLIIVYRKKKSANRVNSHLSQKQLKKAQ